MAQWSWKLLSYLQTYLHSQLHRLEAGRNVDTGELAVIKEKNVDPGVVIKRGNKADEPKLKIEINNLAPKMQHRRLNLWWAFKKDPEILIPSIMESKIWVN